MSFLTVEDTIPLFKSYGIPNLDLVEFGVYSGNCLKRLIDGMESIGKPFNKVWAADAFVGGLPKETEGLWQNPDWTEHAFDISADKGLKSVEEAIAYVHNHVERDNVVYVPGYFAESLTVGLAKNMGEHSLSYAHVDCDIHSSSLQALTFLFQYKLLCIGAIIRFDDICSAPRSAGQHLAWSQTIRRHNVKNRELADNVFLVLGYE